MHIGIIGLGRMGAPIAKKLKKTNCPMSVYDRNPAVLQGLENEGFRVARSVEELSSEATIIWLMVPPAGVDEVLDELCACTKKGTILVDGGNSFYKDTQRRYTELAQKGFHFLDCGTSGGLWGAEHGFSLTVGGDHEVFKRVEELFKLLAASAKAYLYVGSAGSGHYVKMVHNGIEYGMLQAYGEGFSLLHDGPYKELDLAAISKSWMEAGVIRSWLLGLANRILAKDQDFASIDGSVGENGTGRWAANEAKARAIQVPVIEASLKERELSRETGGTYATKLVALLRHEMGGHSVGLEFCTVCKRVCKE